MEKLADAQRAQQEAIASKAQADEEMRETQPEEQGSRGSDTLPTDPLVEGPTRMFEAMQGKAEKQQQSAAATTTQAGSLVFSQTSMRMRETFDGSFKAVAVEKPVAGSVEDILECHAVCQANDVPLYCSFQRRTDRTYEELAAAVRRGAVGPVRSVHAVFRDHPVPSIDFLKQGGDIFHDLAPHDVDFVCFSLGLGEPSEVYATANSFVPQLEQVGVKDSAHCLFTFPNGAVFTLEMTRCSAYGYDNRIEVMGENGMLSLGNPPSSGLEFFDSSGCTTSPLQHSFPQRFREAYAMEMGEFEQALRGKSEPPVTCFDSCRTTHIAEQASISACIGRPVPISFEGMPRGAA
eukprot:jgi/Undpi1/1328/HiC_scaffold_11.g04720.m1